MQTTYLKDFNKYVKNSVAYIPIGTIEWHGNHLPIETDFLVALRICELASQKISGYILPPIYLGSSSKGKFKDKEFIGMDRRLGKKLSGSVYYIKPNLLFKLIESLIKNLISQEFKKIIIVTGHASSKHTDALEKVEKKFRQVIFINPYAGFKVIGAVEHANKEEISIFWACYPKEMAKISKIKISKNDDYVNYVGYDPRQQASLALGRKLLKEIIGRIIKKIK